MEGYLEKTRTRVQLWLQHHSFFPELEVKKIIKKVDQTSRNRACKASLKCNSFCNGYTDLRAFSPHYRKQAVLPVEEQLAYQPCV